MADRCCTYTFGGVTINGALTTDTLIISDDDSDGITGLDGAPVRRQVDNLAGTSGGDSQPPWFGPRIITFNLRCFCGTVGDSGSLTVYNAALVALQKNVTAALEAQLNSATNLAWTDSAGASRSISCVYGMPGGEVQFSGSVRNNRCTFQLLAENPTITG